MVRFLLYANEFDVEALVASSATFANIARKENILDILNFYDEVDENLRRHDPRYPTADALRAITYEGRDGAWGRPAGEVIGEGRDTEASDAIIRIVDRLDPRPVWFSIWGGPREVAQAIWKVRATRNASELEAFLGKLRIFSIGAQDGSLQWMKENFPDLFIIHSGASTYGGMFCRSGDTSQCDVAWLEANVRMAHGPLGAVYPPAASATTGVMEGDSPSFMHLVSAVRGINDPEDPSEIGWGGQYARSGSTNHWVDCCGGETILRWRADIQREFAERADWMLP
jgi:hypothetical protein